MYREDMDTKGALDAGLKTSALAVRGFIQKVDHFDCASLLGSRSRTAKVTGLMRTSKNTSQNMETPDLMDDVISAASADRVCVAHQRWINLIHR